MDVPIEILWLKLCKQYHCLPSQLDEEPIENINMMMDVPEIEDQEMAYDSMQKNLIQDLKN